MFGIVYIDCVVNVIEAGFGVSFFLTEFGQLLSSGKQNYNGRNISSDIPTKVEVLADKNIKSINAGRIHFGCTTDEGVLYLWGSNACRQLGENHKEGSYVITPTPMK